MREMKKASSQQVDTFTSPGAPHYRRHSMGSRKGWFSERMTQPTNSEETRHIIGSSSLITFNSNGRTLPSKWEDAERWICSPVSHSQLQKRPNSKSKSSPNILPETALTHFIHSPFSSGVIAADKDYDTGITGEIRHAYEVFNVPERSELSTNDRYPSPKVKNLGEENNDETLTYGVDIDIQVSPIRCEQSSPIACHSIGEQQNEHSAKFEVTDVQEDKRATTIKSAKRLGIRINNKRSFDVHDFHENDTEVRTSSFDLAEAAMVFSKFERKEAEITAWENLQVANAEAAMKKLEMKLVKKRSSSMEKIITKFRTAQIKADTMRGRLSVQKSSQVPEYSYRIFSFHRPIRFGLLRHCFTADAV